MLVREPDVGWAVIVRRVVRTASADASADASANAASELCDTPLLRWSSELDLHRPLPETSMPTQLTSAGHGEQPPATTASATRPRARHPGPESYRVPLDPVCDCEHKPASNTGTSTARSAVVPASAGRDPPLHAGDESRPEPFVRGTRPGINPFPMPDTVHAP